MSSCSFQDPEAKELNTIQQLTTEIQDQNNKIQLLTSINLDKTEEIWGLKLEVKRLEESITFHRANNIRLRETYEQEIIRLQENYKKDIVLLRDQYKKESIRLRGLLQDKYKKKFHDLVKDTEGFIANLETLRNNSSNIVQRLKCFMNP